MQISAEPRAADDTRGRRRVSGPGDGPVALRRFPYPYRAALAICSDIDDTRSTGDLVELHRFLNTRGSTGMGEGLGLEIGNSVYFYDDDAHLSYFTGDDRARGTIEELIRAGYIDCLHSYGDANSSRDEIVRALDALGRAGCRLEVWVNHNGGMSNLSQKFGYMFGRAPCLGAVPGSPVYHADLTIAHGVRFAWVGAFTRVVGQSAERPPALAGLIDRRAPLHSAASLLKETRKQLLGGRGDERFVLHRENRLTRPLALEDGRRVHEFIRYCDHPRGVPYGGTAHGLARQIGPAALGRLKDAGGFMIVYTHLGQCRDPRHLLPPETQAALRGLADEHRGGAIDVMTTARLLNYHLAYTSLRWSYGQEGRRMLIDIERIDDPIFGAQPATPQRLQGLTFHVPDSRRAHVRVGGAEVPGIVRNPPDERGRPSVSLPRVPLSFPL